MTNPEEQGRLDFGPEDDAEDPSSIYWRYDPAAYVDNPEQAEQDIQIWADALFDAEERDRLEAIEAKREAAKSPAQIEREDIAAVLKSVRKADPQLPLGDVSREGLSESLDTLVAWGSAMPSKLVNANLLKRLTTDDLHRAGAGSLRYALLGRKRGPTTYDHVAMHDREYSRIFTSAAMLKKRVEARTRQKGAGHLSFEARIENAKEESVKAHDRVSDNISKLLTFNENERVMLLELKHLVGGFRFKLVDNLTLQYLRAGVYDLSFRAMLETAAVQLNWTAEQAGDAKLAMDARLFYGPQHVKTRYWNKMVDLALDYNNARSATLQSNQTRGRQIMKPAS